jgi:hypothetical protein
MWFNNDSKAVNQKEITLTDRVVSILDNRDCKVVINYCKYLKPEFFLTELSDNVGKACQLVIQYQGIVFLVQYV